VETADRETAHFAGRVEEMHRFYELMGEHLGRFLDDWGEERRRIVAAWATRTDSAPGAETTTEAER